MDERLYDLLNDETFLNLNDWDGAPKPQSVEKHIIDLGEWFLSLLSKSIADLADIDDGQMI